MWFFMLVVLLKIALVIIIFIILVYTLRHYWFTVNRLFGKQRHPYINIDTAQWPSVTVLVAAHNEEAVISHSIEALVQVNYPREKLKIIIVNDRSSDRTQEIVDSFVMRYPDLIVPFHREGGIAGKASALKDATKIVTSDIIIVFDADYIPGRGLIKQLAAPFFDPEVGLTMGRVVPLNTGKNLLTRLLDLERSGGYQVDQQARMNLELVPQYGGTVGGIRMEALRSVGGWLDNTLAEDTDLTYRVILRGWKSIYQNRSECYEEVPETWPVRINQIARWARGHNQSLFRYGFRCLFSRRTSLPERLDGFLLLGVYAMSPIILIGWIISIILFYMGEANLINGAIALLAVTSYSVIGNFAAFFEISSAVYLDRGKNRIRLLPLNFFNFLISITTVSLATITQVIFGRRYCKKWKKTERFRHTNLILG
jgi:cellulose synthase/poly-beta-1,6-N-acetylglucosamine synthase-like glycosyltransferase